MLTRLSAAALLLAGCAAALFIWPSALLWPRWFFENDQIARWTALVIWTGLTCLLTVPARRRLFGQPLYVDDLLFAAWLLTLNRICFSVQALVHDDTLADVSRWTGIAAAIFYGYVVCGYVWPTVNWRRRDGR